MCLPQQYLQQARAEFSNLCLDSLGSRQYSSATRPEALHQCAQAAVGHAAASSCHLQPLSGTPASHQHKPNNQQHIIMVWLCTSES